MIQRNLVHLLNVAIRECRSLQASEPASKPGQPKRASRERASEGLRRWLARPVSLAQTGELARRL